MEVASTVITVGTAEELKAALQTAKGGEIIELEAGNYGRLGINVPYGDPWGAFAGEVTIRSADADSPATFTGINLRGVTNLTFDGILLDFTSAEGLTTKQADQQIGMRVNESTNITVRNSVLEGDVRDDPGSTIDGLPVVIGLGVRDSQGLIVENNEFLNWTRGATFGQTSEITVQGNDIHTIRSDGLDFADADHVLIADNHIHDFVSNSSAGDHRDMIQFWTAGTSSPSTDIVIRDNVLNSGSTVGTQTIFMRNELVDSYGAGQEMFYQNVTIENNTIYNSHLHGITVGATSGLVIQNNSLLHNSDTGTGAGVYTPRINIARNAEDVTVLNNIAAGVTEAPEGASGWNVANNLIVQDTSPDKPNFYDHLFINALVGGKEADLAAIQALPGGIVEESGVGSLLTRYDPTPDDLTAIVRTEGRTGDMFAFNGIFSANSQGRVDQNHATFQWDMGDGTTLQGIGVNHTYSAPGTYTVKLTVTHGDGSIDTAFTEAYVEEPLRLSLDGTEAGLVDRSTYEVKAPTDVEVVLDGDRYATRISDKAGFNVWAPVYDLDAFTISLDLRALDGAGSAGEIFRIHTGMLLTIGQDGRFSFDLTNAEEKTFSLRTGGTGALDGDWHNLDLTYSDSSGALTLYLDGEEIGSAAASGWTQPRESWGLSFGSSFKSGFDGLIDDIRIRDEEASALEIRNDRAGIDTPITDPVPVDETDLGGIDTPVTDPVPVDETDLGGIETPDPDPVPEDETDLGETDAPDPAPVPEDGSPGGIGFAVMDFASSSQDPGVTFHGDAAISTEETALLDGRGYISMSSDAQPDFTGAISVAFDVRFSEAPASSDSVRLLWDHLEFGLQLRHGKLQAAVATADDGLAWTHGAEHELFDGAWHRLSLSIDSKTDTLRLYADGDMLIEQTDRDIELSDGFRPLTFGSDGWKGSMVGEIDDIVVGNAAMETLMVSSEAWSL